MIDSRSATVIAMILAAALSRLVPHPPNLSSVAAVALFGGAYLADKRLAFLVPLGALPMDRARHAEVGTLLLQAAGVGDHELGAGQHG